MGNATHAKKTRVFVDGNDLSTYLNDAGTDASCSPLESTTFGATDKTFETNTPEAKASLKGFYWSKLAEADPLDRDAIDDILHAALGDETRSLIVTICHEGADATALSATLFKTKVQKYSVTAPHDALVSCMAEMTADGGMRYGSLLASALLRTATANGTAVDLLAATALGFEAHLHIYGSAPTADTLDVVIEDSADGATGWATIGTFTQQTGAATERLTLTGNVRRYVRARWTIGGSPVEGFTFLVSFALKTF